MTKHSWKKYTSIPCANKIDCNLIEKLWKEIERYWVGRGMRAKKSMLF